MGLFKEICEAFESTCTVQKTTLGNGTIRLMRQCEPVDFAVRWIEQNREMPTR